MIKKILTILILLLIVNSKILAQYPIREEFNPGTTWTFTNGAGIQNYGGAENYATTNIGTTPYPNNAIVTIVSPNTYNLTNCIGILTISFHLSGRIENNYDFLDFQYKIGAGGWITVQTFTGVQNLLYTYTTIPNTATRFRFRLRTDISVNTYGFPFVSVYYYDIQYFEITCSSVLPIKLLNFSGYPINTTNKIIWSTSTEINNDFFILEKSNDMFNWEEISKIPGNGNSNTIINYEYIDKTPYKLSYYRLQQIDYNGQFEYFEPIVIKNENDIKFNQINGKIYLSSKQTYQIWNTAGQLVKTGVSNIIIINDLPSSIYFIKYGNTITKFIKK